MITVLYPGPFLIVTSGWHKVLPHRWGVGVHPSLESPAVSGYIIAEPCWACRTALWGCHWMWLWVRLSGGWEAPVKGAPTWSPAEMTEQTESEVFGESFNVARQESYPPPPPFHGAHCVREKCFLLTCSMFYVSPEQGPPKEKLDSKEWPTKWASSGDVVEQMV